MNGTPVWILLLVAVIASVPPTVAAMMVRRGVRDLHVIVNSRLTELLASTKEAAELQGRANERADPAREEKEVPNE